MTTPIIADTGGPDGDGPTLLEVLAALGWTMTPPRANGQHNTYTDPAGYAITAHVADVWALLRRRGLIAYVTTPHCPTCGYTTGFPPGWTTPQGNAPDPTPRPCQCWRLAELPT